MVDSWNAAQLNEAANNGSIGGGSDLPDVTASDNGDVLGVVEGAWGKMSVTSGVNYSTSEQDTGLTLGTAKVYQKSYSGDLAGSGQTILEESFAHNIISVDGFFKSSSGLGMSLGDMNTSGWAVAIHLDTDHNVVIHPGSALLGGTYFVTLRYTKSS